MKWLLRLFRRDRPTSLESLAEQPFRIPFGRWAAFDGWTPARAGYCAAPMPHIIDWEAMRARLSTLSETPGAAPPSGRWRAHAGAAMRGTKTTAHPPGQVGSGPDAPEPETAEAPAGRLRVMR